MRPGKWGLAACLATAMISPARADSTATEAGGIKTGSAFDQLFRPESHALDLLTPSGPTANVKGALPAKLVGAAGHSGGFEHYLFIQGDVGEVNLGPAGDTPYAMQFTAPVLAGPGSDSPALDAVPHSGPRSASYLLLAGDAYRIGYFTPRFSGLGGLSPNSGTAPSQAPQGALGRAGEHYQNHDVGANYVARFKGLDLALTAEHAEAIGERGITVNPRAWSFGFGLSYSGFKMGGSYYRAQDFLLDSAALPRVQERGYTFGLGYGGADWWVGTGMSRLSQGQPSGTSGTNGTTTYRLGGEYKLRPGMLVFSDLLLFSNNRGGAGPAVPSPSDQGAVFFGMDLNF